MQNKLTNSIVNYYEQRDPLGIAIARYVNGLESVHLIHISVSYAVMTIEALLISSDEDFKKKKCALRTSKLLGLLGLNPNKVHDYMRLAYEIRSKYAHGDTITKKIKDKIHLNFKHEEQIGFLIMDYARLILVIFIILGKSKDTLIELLKNAETVKGENLLRKELKIISMHLMMTNYNPEFKTYPLEEHRYTII